METNVLVNKINQVLCNTITCQLFLVLKIEGNLVLKIADIDDEIEKNLREMFIRNIEETILNNDDIELCSLAGDDERKNAIYLYDYPETPEISTLKNFNEQIDHNFSCSNFSLTESKASNFFSFENDDLSLIYGYFISLGTNGMKLGLFKRHYNISLIKRNSFLLGLKKSDRRFALIKDTDILRMNGSSHILFIKGEIYILDLEVLQKSMKFLEVIKKSANNAIQLINKLDIVDDIEVLTDSLDNITFSRKLAKLSNSSPIFSLNIKKEDIIKYSKNKKLKDKFKYSLDGNRFILDTKKSKNAFIQLLNDSFLVSELTNQYYEAKAKDTIYPDKN